MIDALVIDDSALVRQLLVSILNARGMQVRTAPDPLVAMTKIRQRRPTVIVLDLELPRMHGLEFLAWLAADPIPVVVCSTLAGAGTEPAVRALELGALDLVEKPKIGIRDFLEESATTIGDAVAAAASAKLFARRRSAEQPSNAELLQFTSDKVIGIGASTGGTEAVRQILSAMPPNAPGIVVVQHMPAGFTAAFARRLDEECAIDVREAVHGERVTTGNALIAPGDRHIEVLRSGAQYVVSISDGPRVTRHRPSVDVLFHSLAAAAGPNALAVILTGMGADGADGMLAMRRAGARTIAQDEATSVVYGMPKEAVARGAVEQIAPLDRIPPLMLSAVAATTRTPRLPRAH